MKTYALEFVLFGWLAYNIAIEIVSWFEPEEELQAPPAMENHLGKYYRRRNHFSYRNNVAG